MESVPLRSLFPLAQFEPPATEAQIVAVERTLGVRFPEQLRRLYLECNGFREDRGLAACLIPLYGDHVQGSVEEMTLYFRMPSEPAPDFRSYVFFGNSSWDEFWAINSRRGCAGADCTSRRPW